MWKAARHARAPQAQQCEGQQRKEQWDACYDIIKGSTFRVTWFWKDGGALYPLYPKTRLMDMFVFFCISILVVSLDHGIFLLGSIFFFSLDQFCERDVLSP